jgi:hypothetical protein
MPFADKEGRMPFANKEGRTVVCRGTELFFKGGRTPFVDKGGRMPFFKGGSHSSMR